MKIKTFLTIALVLTMPFCFAEDAKRPWQPELRIGIMNNLKTANVTASRDCVLFLGGDKIKVSKGENITVILNDTFFDVKGKKFYGDFFDIRTDDPREISRLILKINGKSYRGGLRFLHKKSTMTVINTLPAEDYLCGVVPEEMPPLWPKEALKAQTIAARTFALKNRKRHEAEGFDLCSSVHCQVYTGANNEHLHSDTAIRETYGEVLFAAPNGPIIDTPFHTDSGGMTENNEEIWGRGIPYLRAVKELEEKTKPWTKTISILDFEKKIGITNIKKIDLSELVIGKATKDRTKSGRVKSVNVIGEKRAKSLTGLELRNMFNLNSTLFDMKLNKRTVDFFGYGIGHGIGMSQWGAKALAENGWDYKKILEHYYKKTFIKKLY